MAVRFTSLAVAGVAVLAVTSLAGCGRGDDDTSSGGSDEVTAGVVLKTLSNPYWVAMRDGVDAEAPGLSVSADVQAGTSEDSIDEQTDALSTIVSGGADCYVVAPITGTNLVQPLAGVAEDATVINVDSPVDAEALDAAGVEITSFIASNNETAGQLAGEQMVELLGGSGTVAVVGGLAGDAASNDRTGGFRTAAEAGGLTVVSEVNADWDRELALTATEGILRGQPDLGGVYAANDGMALGVLQAVQNASAETAVIGTDGNEDAVQSVADGALTATVAQSPYVMGVMAMEACAAAAAGEELPAQVDAPLTLITADNAQTALDSYPEPPSDDYEDPFRDLLAE